MTTLRVTWAESAVQEALAQLIDWRDKWATTPYARPVNLQTIQIAIDALRGTEQPHEVPAPPPGFMVCPDCDGMGEIYPELTRLDLALQETMPRHCHRCEQWNGFVPIDHTSGVMRCRFQVLGGHVHCTVFGPYSGNAGQLIIRVDEWEHFKTKCVPGWHFVDDTAIDAVPMAWQ